jgi:hypothetical protein
LLKPGQKRLSFEGELLLIEWDEDLTVAHPQLVNFDVLEDAAIIGKIAAKPVFTVHLSSSVSSRQLSIIEITTLLKLVLYSLAILLI